MDTSDWSWRRTWSRGSPATGCAASIASAWRLASIHPRLLLKWFDNEYAARHPEIGREVERARRTMASPLRLALAEIRLGFGHRLNAHHAPLERAQFIAAVFEKTG